MSQPQCDGHNVRRPPWATLPVYVRVHTIYMLGTARLGRSVVYPCLMWRLSTRARPCPHTRGTQPERGSGPASEVPTVVRLYVWGSGPPLNACRRILDKIQKPPFSGEGRCVLNPSGLVSGLRAGLRLDRSRETRPVAPSPRPGRPLLLLWTFIGLQVHRYARVLRGGKSSPPTSPTTKTFCRGRRASGDLTRMAPATGRRAVSGYKTCLRAAKPPNTEYM